MDPARPRTLGVLPAALFVAVAVSVETAHGAPVMPPAPARLAGPVSAFLLRSLEAALEEASRKLSDPRCVGVFSEFSGQDGRPLARALSAQGISGAEYLSRLVFLDGAATKPCASDRILAWTTPGSRGVFLCGWRFAREARRDPGLGSIILIHEEFHSLGLGENPPSSAEITARISARCGR